MAKYKNNTLAGTIGNAYEADKEGLKRLGNEFVKLNKQWAEHDINQAKEDFGELKDSFNDAYNYITGSPEKVEPELPEGEKMPEGNYGRSLRYTRGTNADGSYIVPSSKPIQQPTSENTQQSTNSRISQSNSQQTTPPTQQQLSQHIVTPTEFGGFGGNYGQNVQEDTVEEDTLQSGQSGGSVNQDEGYIQGVTQNMQAALGTSDSQDHNNPYKIDNNARVIAVQDFMLQSPSGVALSLSGGDNAYSEQTLRDVKRFAPEYRAEVESELKKIQAGDVVNAIASGEPLPDTGKTSINNVNNGVNTWAESVSSTPQQTSYTIQNTQNAMDGNQIAQSATQLISSLDAQIEEYNSKINNLTKEANAAFKGDVPQYVVNAYINNRTQKYQAEIEKLEGRRQSALDLYKIELSNYQWGVEMDLKYKQFNQDVNNDNWNRWYKTQQLNMDRVKIIDGKAYMLNSDGTMTQVADETAYYSYMSDVQNAINGYMALYTAGGGTKTATGYKYNVSGGQCQVFTNNFTERVTGLRMKGVYAADKISYINEESGIPQVGDIAIAVGGVYDSTYGHTMLVTGYDPSTGMVDLLWSNNGGDEMVYSTQDTLSNLYAKGLRGFWNPYKDMIKTEVSNGTYGYNENGVLITPMTSTFDRLIEDASSGGDRESIAASERAYNTLYEIINDGSLNELITSGDFGKMWNVISKADFANTGDDDGYTFKGMLTQYLQKQAAKEFSGGTTSMNALRKLIELVESKLRDESGAVINSGEWKSNFELFLPMPGDTEDYMWDKMGDWDNIIVKGLRKGGMSKATDYIPLFPKSSKRETW